MSPTVRGALWMGGAVLSFCAMAIAVRELQRHMGAFQILFVRSLMMLAIVAAMLPRTGGGSWRTQHLSLHVWRSLVHLAGQYLWVYCIGLLALATVFAVEFTMPVWVAVLASLFLGERLNRGRLVQLVLGLAGVMVILRPGAGAVHPAALLMVVASLCYAVTMILAKRLSATDSPHTVLFWMSLVQAPVTLAAALPGWAMPPPSSLPWIVVIGTASYAAHYCITRSMSLVDATVAVPIDFIRLPLIALAGAALYAEPLDPLVFVGAAVIFAGTYYSIRRESAR